MCTRQTQRSNFHSINKTSKYNRSPTLWCVCLRSPSLESSSSFLTYRPETASAGLSVDRGERMINALECSPRNLRLMPSQKERRGLRQVQGPQRATHCTRMGRVGNGALAQPWAGCLSFPESHPPERVIAPLSPCVTAFKAEPLSTSHGDRLPRLIRLWLSLL